MKRCRHDIVADILRALASLTPKNVNRLALEANLSHRRARILLETMALRGLVQKDEEGRYVITSRGFEWLRLYELLVEMYDPPALS
ncbi:hypothetical protein PYJP_11580 [Pyrofollis japonicus]|uniref:winged helix-turn-helix domain-containing protein n=1 Tax=Pyrofollis japonicus TaxID=3060460 RepID=UPI00295BD48E|nr:winged helix-turn-helix domain-containing protein [Pyrofollis japonicus]BEP17806.1 hypothetical protein PYJP_11580 [Pyrofollis japonicus]